MSLFHSTNEGDTQGHWVASSESESTAAQEAEAELNTTYTNLRCTVLHTQASRGQKGALRSAKGPRCWGAQNLKSQE